MTLIMRVPLTGTVLVERRFPSGDEGDPIRPINILGQFDVAWKLVDIDLEREEMEIEIDCPRHVNRFDPVTGDPIPDEDESVWEARKTAAFTKIQDLLLNHTKDELYTLTGEPRLKRPFKRNQNLKGNLR